ncbi:MAG: AbiEi antitoxin N-terminal domain-containing protein [Rhizobium sp.]
MLLRCSTVSDDSDTQWRHQQSGLRWLVTPPWDSEARFWFTASTICGEHHRKPPKWQITLLDAERRSRLFDLLPEGTPVSKSRLMRRDTGLDRQAIDNLLKSRQLEPMAQAVYIRPGSQANWKHAVTSLQNIFRLDVVQVG